MDPNQESSQNPPQQYNPPLYDSNPEQEPLVQTEPLEKFGPNEVPRFKPDVAPPHINMSSTSQRVFPEHSVRVKCFNCDCKVDTVVRKQAGGYTLLLAVLLAMVGCACCSWVPFFVDSTKDVVHSCPRCAFRMGEFKKTLS